MFKSLGLRLRIALFFVALAAGGSVLYGVGLYFAQSRTGGDMQGYVIGWLIGSFGLLALCAWFALLFDENVAQPLRGLAADLKARAASDVDVDIDQMPARYLGSIAPAAQALFTSLAEARRRQNELLEERTQVIARDKLLLETLIRDLSEGVVLLASDGAILLYNRAAAQMLGPIGVERPLERFMSMEAVSEAMRGLDHDKDAESETFLTATGDGRAMLAGAVVRVAHDGELIGYLLIFHDATEDLRAQGDIDHVLTELIDGARRPAMAISAVLDVMGGAGPLTQPERDQFTQALGDEVRRLGRELSRAEDAQATLSVGNWPIHDVPAIDILDKLSARYPKEVSFRPDVAILRCDGFAIMKIWENVLGFVLSNGLRTNVELSVRAEERSVSLVLTWDGPSVAQSKLDALLSAPFSEAYTPYCGADVLKAHRTDLRLEGGGRLVMPLSRVVPKTRAPRKELLDFYNFDNRRSSVGATHLDALSYVVFDTETTGLDTVKDEVVQIAGVRILRDRFLKSETFDSLVSPGRDIPLSASEIHGVTNEMVKTAPPFEVAGESFQSFAEGSVLVAHNAEFDMAFLKRLEARGGPRFDNPVVCTARLSAKLNAHTSDHTLDALAVRYGVTLSDDVRHTALGDAIATAEVFLKMLPVLADQNVRDLDGLVAFQSS